MHYSRQNRFKLSWSRGGGLRKYLQAPEEAETKPKSHPLVGFCVHQICSRIAGMSCRHHQPAICPRRATALMAAGWGTCLSMQGQLHFHDAVPGAGQTTLSLAQPSAKTPATHPAKRDKGYTHTRVRAGCFALFLELPYHGQEDTHTFK